MVCARLGTTACRDGQPGPGTRSDDASFGPGTDVVDNRARAMRPHTGHRSPEKPYYPRHPKPRAVLPLPPAAAGGRGALEARGG
jgi:hypothetical protein